MIILSKKFRFMCILIKNNLLIFIKVHVFHSNSNNFKPNLFWPLIEP